jgi:hypothetical protein
MTSVHEIPTVAIWRALPLLAQRRGRIVYAHVHRRDGVHLRVPVRLGAEGPQDAAAASALALRAAARASAALRSAGLAIEAAPAGNASPEGLTAWLTWALAELGAARRMAITGGATDLADALAVLIRRVGEALAAVADGYETVWDKFWNHATDRLESVLFGVLAFGLVVVGLGAAAYLTVALSPAGQGFILSAGTGSGRAIGGIGIGTGRGVASLGAGAGRGLASAPGVVKVLP